MPTTTTDPTYLTTAELAARWKASQDHVRRLARDQRLPSTRIGRLLRFDLDDVTAFERSHHSETREPPRSRRGGSRRA